MLKIKKFILNYTRFIVYHYTILTLVRALIVLKEFKDILLSDCMREFMVTFRFLTTMKG